MLLKKHGQSNFSKPSPIPAATPSRMQITQLQQYQVIKLLASGDYLCADKLGNRYLMVCHSEGGEKGVQQFFIKTKSKFHRNNSNRSLLTPFEDIEYHGLIYTVFMIPEHATCITDTPEGHFKSEIFCLSLLFSLVNKIVKPLIEIFGNETMKWIHQENIWIKENSVFYVLSERRLKKCKKPSNTSPHPSLNEGSSLSQRQKQQKQLLHKLCVILIPYLQMDHELKSFQSIIIDSIVNQEFGINQIIQLLTSKEKRKKFVSERIQLNTESVNVKEIMKENGEFWRKKSFNAKVEGGGGHRKYSVNLQSSLTPKSGFEYRSELSVNLPHNVIPHSVKSSKRYSLSPTGMFDFRKLSKKKRNSSLHEQKPSSSYKHQTISMSLSKQFQHLRPNVKCYRQHSKIQSVTMSVKQRAYRKFTEYANRKMNESINIDELQLNIMSKKNSQIHQYLPSKKSLSIQKCQTIDICEQVNNKQINNNNHYQSYRNKYENKIENNFNDLQIKKQLFSNQNNQQQFIQTQQPQSQEKSKIPYKIVAPNKNQQTNKQQSTIKPYNVKQIQTIQCIIPKQSEKDTIQLFNTNKYKKQPQKDTIQLFNNSKQNNQQQKDTISLYTNNKLKNYPQKDTIQLLNINKQKRQQQKIPQPSIYNNVQQNPDLDHIQIIEPAFQSKIKKKEPKVESINNINNLDEIQQIQLQKHGSYKYKKQQNNKSISQKQSKDSNSQKNKPISTIPKQVNQYIQMINKLGESATKSGKLKQKLEGIQWFIGIYFIYKRFLYQRRKIEKWLQRKQPHLTRYSYKDITEWEQWFNSEQKKQLEAKIKEENKSITVSIVSMNKKLLKKNLPEYIRNSIPLENYSPQQSKIAVSEVIKEYDALDENDKLNDQEIVVHVNELLNSLYIIAELDGKIKEKKPLVEMCRKLSVEEIQNFSDFIYQLYIKE